jgi:hypothetical protein
VVVAMVPLDLTGVGPTTPTGTATAVMVTEAAVRCS